MTPFRTFPLLALAAAALLAACGGGDRPASPASAPQAAASAPRAALTVTAAVPQEQVLAQQVVANGNVAAWQEAIVGANVQGLRIAELKANVGDVVRAGQVLATFDAAPVRQDEAQAQAQLAEAEAQLAEAAGNAERARAVQDSGALSRQQIAQYQTAEKTARARVQAARAVLAAQRLRVGRTEVRAPDAGVISARSATVGQVANEGTELFRLVRRGRLEWRADVMAEDLPRLRPGQPVQLSLPGPPGQAPQVAGRLRQLGPTVDPKTRYATAYVDLPADAPARAGMFATGRIDVGESRALTVPQESLVMRDGYAHVLLLQPGGAVRLQRVRTGRLAADRVELLDALPAGARVVVRGAAFLNDGDQVRVADDAAPNPPQARSSQAPKATE